MAGGCLAAKSEGGREGQRREEIGFSQPWSLNDAIELSSAWSKGWPSALCAHLLLAVGGV